MGWADGPTHKNSVDYKPTPSWILVSYISYHLPSFFVCARTGDHEKVAHHSGSCVCASTDERIK